MFSDILATDLKNRKVRFDSISFFKRNLVSELILYTILKKDKINQVCSFEELFNEICPKFGSRNMVKQIVAAAIIKNFFIKTENIIDKRSLNIRPTDLTINEFEIWKKEYLIGISQN